MNTKFTRGFTTLLLCAGALLFGGCGRVRPTPAALDAASHALPTRRTPPPPNGIMLENVAASRGVRFRWPALTRPIRNIDTMGCGCAFLDYDNDGWQDVLLVGPDRVALFHNRGGGVFDDVSKAMGLEALTRGGDSLRDGRWLGVAVADYDGDGYLDVLLTGYHRLALLKNRGGKRFDDVTAAVGLSPKNRGHWAESAGFMDLSGDNTLALVITNYIAFGPKDDPYCQVNPRITIGCPPDHYASEYPELWRIDRDGHFTEITAAAGMSPRDRGGRQNMHGKAMVVAFADIDGDGMMDFYIGNDTIPADMMRNEGHLKFKNVAAPSGLAYGRMDHAIAAMGADWADYDHDGKLDLVVSAFSDEGYSLMHNNGNGTFTQKSDETMISGPTFFHLGFGAKWIDIDNDGWDDVLFANGHVYDQVADWKPGNTFRQPLMLFRNDHGKRLVDIAPSLGGDMVRPLLARGAASGDIDNDGKMDFLVVDLEGEPLLMHNVTQNRSHWITLDLRGRAPNRFAYGATITACSGSQKWVGQVSPASSYLSSSDPRVHFGLGDTTTLDSVAIRWSDGHRQVLHGVAVDRILSVVEDGGVLSTKHP